MTVTVETPTSRLHAATNALARWDHETGGGDVGGGEVLPDHWDGAQAVWDALQPKYTDAADLDALPAGATLVKHDRHGVSVYVKGPHGLWHQHVRSGQPVHSEAPYPSGLLLDVHTSLRLLWEPR
jgi:hypothetical protein